MKNKIKLMLFLLLGIMILPMVAKADMGAPEIKPYELTVDNKSGISLYDSDYDVIDTIPYGTVITVSYEYKEDGIRYGYLYDDSNYSGIVKLSDFAGLDIEITPEQDNWEFCYYKPRKVLIVGSDIYLHSGPANGYKAVTKAVPSLTTLEYNCTDQDYGTWGYTEYEGVKGWLDLDSNSNDIALSCSLYDDEENCPKKTIMTLDKIYLYALPDTTSDKVSKEAIPASTKLSYEFELYYGKIDYTYWVYLTYNGVSGWAMKTDSPLASGYNSKLLTYKDINLYTSPLDGGKETAKTVVANTELEISYYYYSYDTETEEYNEWYYVKYKGDYYWLGKTQDFVLPFEDGEEGYGEDGYAQEIKDKNTYIYSRPDSSSAKVIEEAIPMGTELNLEYYGIDDEEANGTWYYVVYDGNKGWILYDNETFVDDTFIKELAEAYNKALTAVEKAEKSKNIEDVNAAYILVNKLRIGSDKMLLLERLSIIKIETETVKPVAKEDKLSPKEIVYYSVGGAVVLALVTFVTIKLINKKRKAKIIDLIKKEEPKEPEAIKAEEEIAVTDNKKVKKKAKK